MTSTRSLARAAVAGIAVFPTIVICLHFVQAGRYHPLADAVSELALGRDGWLMAIAFCSLGTSTLLLALVLRRLGTRVAPWLIGASGLLSYGSAFVHADGNGPTTTHGQIHQALGITTFILMIVGMFSTVRAFRRNPEWQSFATPTLVWACGSIVAFFGIPLSGSAYFGVAQRIFLTVILGWAVTVAVRAWRPRLAATRDDFRGRTQSLGAKS